MSAPSARRIKDRGGAGAKVAASRPGKSLTPLAIVRSVPGKENSGCGSKPNPQAAPLTSAQKPALRAVPPRVSGDGARWSSSVPRGRSPSPFGGRVGSDGKKDRVLPRVSLEGREAEKKEKRGVKEVGVKSRDESGGGSRILRDLKDKVKKGGACEQSSIVKVGVKGKNVHKVNGEVCIDSESLVKSSEVDTQSDSKRRTEEVGVDLSGQPLYELSVDKKSEEGTNADLASTSGVASEMTGNASAKCLSSSGVVKGVSSEAVNGQVGNKYSSRLHEKLAFLEGKVRRIASDIKRTKEILDLNNPDESKVVLSDIQEKISGIEKAIGHAIGDSDGKMAAAKNTANAVLESDKLVGETQVEKKSSSKCSVKVLNSEELEARLFPHHKLLKNRTSVKASIASTQSSRKAGVHEMNISEANSMSKVEEKLNPDDNPIALEFLASLDEEQSKFNIKDQKSGVEICEVQEMDGVATSAVEEKFVDVKAEPEVIFTSDEKLDDFDDQENIQRLIIGEENEDSYAYQPHEIGTKTSTGGWFVSEGEAVLLAHDDGSCSYYDITNSEEKAVYKPSMEISPNIWRDCWIIRAPGADGCSGRYVVAASAGNMMDAGFCSWDFYTKDVRVCHIEEGAAVTSSRTVLGSLPSNTLYRRSAPSSIMVPENRLWWYKPCGPLIISTATCQKGVRVYDIRDGEQVMKWEVQKPVLAMDYSSPLQWRNRGKVVIAEAETISLWDVNSLNAQPLLSVPSTGRKISALHVNNTDAEIGGGVRQRVSSSEAEGNDGIFCSADSINIMDFRHPSGVGLKIQKLGISVQSVFSRGDSIFLGCTSLKSVGKKLSCTQVQQFSLRKQGLFSTYALPESNLHSDHAAIAQVWGNSNLVMGVSGQGLFVFDAVKDEALHSLGCGSTQNVREVIGPDDLYSPTFDHLSSRALLISRDRPAMWRRLS
ncbi:hypothetical protein BT93_H1394 [Corymbia citriodora subsp. variegata]|nr:hypothetical protein BT93_H1394 [Corymbia citriodora subsp. variegata]